MSMENTGPPTTGRSLPRKSDGTAIARHRRTPFHIDAIGFMPSFITDEEGRERQATPLLSAGKLIDEAGLKGFSRNGALVSPWHANFIVNQGSAASRDIFQLAELVRSTVCRKFNIELEYEVKLLGKFETE